MLRAPSGYSGNYISRGSAPQIQPPSGHPGSIGNFGTNLSDSGQRESEYLEQEGVEILT